MITPIVIVAVVARAGSRPATPGGSDQPTPGSTGLPVRRRVGKSGPTCRWSE
jgi:hypothetical protein